MDGRMLEVIKSLSFQEWERFWDLYIQNVQSRISACDTTEQLWEQKSRVKMIMEMKQFFLAEMRRK